MKKRKVMLGAGIVLLAIMAGAVAWNLWFSATRIAFVNYQVITLGQIAKANDNGRIRLSALDVEELDKIGNYDMVLINGMGLRITAEQREAIQQAADNGLAVVTTMATNPANEILSADSAAVATIKGYLSGGGRRNYRNMLTFIRRNIDGKTFDSDEPDAPVEREQKQFYHMDPDNPEDEETDFGSVAEYEAFLGKHKLMRADAPRIIVTGQMGEPEELVAELEKTGNTVYCVRNMQAAVRNGQADSIHPSAIINMAHGRMGDDVVNYLTKQNIPLFAPLNVNRLVGEWEADKMGMNGGFMSQSIVMPEIDGAIRPYALFGHRLDDEGLQQAYAIPERLETFVKTVNNHIALQSKPNSEKRVAIYYYKGPGQNALTATGMEVAPSLYNLLIRMKREGYRVENLPASAADLEQLIQRQGAVFNAYAGGAKADFLKNGHPELISAKEYNEWTTAAAIRPEQMAEVTALDGEFPGSYISTEKGELALPRVDLGNVVLLPQLAAGKGDDDFAIVHGTDAAPPHAYIASYLWARYDFGADVMVHFGTHGSLEFTPRKQVALCGNDWPDALVGATPHLYIYSIGDVGEGMIAKRRSYATLQSHLTPPFMESDVRGIYKDLCTAIQQYNDMLYADGHPDTKEAALKVKRLTVELGIHRELRLDSLLTTPYTEQEIARIETFAEELANEKVTGELYTMGEPYSSERIRSSVYAMSVEPIAYSLLALDKQRGKASDELEKHKSLFTRRYLTPARELVTRLLNGSEQISDARICAVAGITQDELAKARGITRSLRAPQDMMAMMMAMQSSGATMKHPAGIPKGKGSGSKHPSWIPKIGKRPANTGQTKKDEPATEMPAVMPGMKEYSKEEKELARVIMEIERTVCNVENYKTALEQSPETEFTSLLNAMSGGCTAPSPGGDPVANPNTLPTGRNLYAVNAEATPSEVAWEHGKELAENTIRMYRERHNDSIPRKVSYTLWSGEFVETEGATVAQVLYMLGVEPVRDVFGRVTDIRLIPSGRLGRPRIDVVVQTSGQLRDIAASRLFLISRAVEMAAAAKEDKYENYVAQSVVDAERVLIDKGLSPKEAREVSAHRVFGGVNGNYGTGITDMVQSGDRWESSTEIADVYLQNMGAFYGSEKDWEQVRQFVLEAALTNTDAVVQPRQSNTWGALSLDHVYEFMGGMNLAVRNVTGKDPDAYLSDYRNRNNMRMQEVKEAVGVESRTTIFNPAYIREKMKGGASAAAGFAEVVQNTYGWNVMKPEAIDNEMWDEIYNVYVQDKFDLGVQDYFEQQNPAALQEMTAVMLETARKGMWNASAEQLKAIAELHTELVDKHAPSCSGFVCNNAKLREFITSKVNPDAARRYEQSVRQVREASLSENKGTVLKREEMNASDKVTTIVSNTLVAVLVVVALAALIWVVRRRRKKLEE
ncbi:MAG: cobaltochelatase subunit CobN [Bacteroidaceae bacterium]|nr:cobaltochelatase subunit CobN [Bacteroidaceae bacterium]